MYKNETIKAVVFDVGGVIHINNTGNSSEKIAEALGIPFQDFREEYFKHNHRTNIENISWEDVVVDVVKKFDQSEEAEATTRRINRDHESQTYLNVELLEIVKSLRKSGLKVGIISNYGSHLRRVLEEEGVTPLVDEIVISGEVGFQKPHREIFDIAFDRLGLSSHEVAFVDDSPKSLEKAGEIGYVPVRFIDNESLIKDLKDLGIDV